MKPVRVVIADDHEIILDAFKSFFAGKLDIVGVASDGRELIHIAQELKPDLIITDIYMPELNGLDASIKLLKRQPHLKIIILTYSDDPDLAATVIRSGIKGYVMKTSAADELFQAIEAVATGATYISPAATGGLLNTLMTGSKDAVMEKLTIRQREILQLLAEGKSMTEAARIVHLTPRTIAFHKYRIMNRLKLDNSAQLVSFALKKGLIQC